MQVFSVSWRLPANRRASLARSCRRDECASSLGARDDGNLALRSRAQMGARLSDSFSRLRCRNAEMRFGWIPAEPINRKNILRAGGERDDTVHLGSKRDPIARPASRRTKRQRQPILDGNVHEQIERAWHFTRLRPEFLHACYEIVGAVVVVFRAPQEPISGIVTCSKKRVMYAGAGIAHDCEYRPPPIRPHHVTHLWPQFQDA